jgi:DnaJ-class molecular chaperone
MSHQNFNLYEELEIEKTATPEEIKKAYKKLAMVKKS